MDDQLSEIRERQQKRYESADLWLTGKSSAMSDIDYLLAQLEEAERNNEQLLIQLRAWFQVFGTTQLTHARARLESAEEKAATAEKKLGEANATVQLYVDLKLGQEAKANELYESCEQLQKKLGESEQRVIALTLELAGLRVKPIVDKEKESERWPQL